MVSHWERPWTEHEPNIATLPFMIALEIIDPVSPDLERRMLDAKIVVQQLFYAVLDLLDGREVVLLYRDVGFNRNGPLVKTPQVDVVHIFNPIEPLHLLDHPIEIEVLRRALHQHPDGISNLDVSVNGDIDGDGDGNGRIPRLVLNCLKNRIASTTPSSRTRAACPSRLISKRGRSFVRIFLAIYVSAMAYVENGDDAYDVFDFVDDPY